MLSWKFQKNFFQIKYQITSCFRLLLLCSFKISHAHEQRVNKARTSLIAEDERWALSSERWEGKFKFSMWNIFYGIGEKEKKSSSPTFKLPPGQNWTAKIFKFDELKLLPSRTHSIAAAATRRMDVKYLNSARERERKSKWINFGYVICSTSKLSKLRTFLSII